MAITSLEIHAPNCTSAQYAFVGQSSSVDINLNAKNNEPMGLLGTFKDCSSLNAPRGFSTDEDGWTVIKSDGRIRDLFYNCSKLTGKYKIEINGPLLNCANAFACEESDIPTVGNLDVIINTSVENSTNVYLGTPFAARNSNLHDVEIKGPVSLGLGTSATGAFANTTNLNKCTIRCSGGIGSGQAGRWEYGFYKSSIRELISDQRFLTGLTQTYRTAAINISYCFNLSNKFRRWKSYQTMRFFSTDGYPEWFEKRIDISGSARDAFNGCTNLTQLNARMYASPTQSMTNIFKNCRLDLPSVQFFSTYSTQNTGSYKTTTIGISRYKLAYDTSKNDYFEAGEVKYTDDDKILYLNHDGTETTEPNDDNNLNDYITKDSTQGSYGNGGYYAKGALKEALDTLTEKGYVLTVEYN